MSAQMHERTEDGRDRHFMQRQGDLWVCACGEHRDKFGRPVETVLMPVPDVREAAE